MDGPAFSDFGQQFLFLLLDGIGYLSQVGLVTINGNLHVLQLLLKFCTLDFQLDKGDKTLERTRDGLPLIAKKTLCIESVS